MTSPLQVIQVPGIGEELQKAIGPLLDAYNRRRQLELQEEELAQRKAEFKQKQDERKAETDMLAQQGELLRGQLLLLEGQMQGDALQQQGVIDAPTLNLGGTSHHPNVQGLANALAPPPSTATPTMGPIARMIRDMPAIAIPGFVQMSSGLRTAIAEQRAGAQADAAIQTALSRIPDTDMRADLGAYAQMRRSGAEIPVDMARQLFPRLFPDDVDPELMNTAIRLAVGTGLSWAAISSQLGMPLKKGGIPPDFRFPLTLNGGRTTDRQSTAQMHYLSMSLANSELENLLGETGGISALQQFDRALDVAGSTGSGVTGFIAELGKMVTNKLLSPKQQQIGQALSAYVQSVRYVMSGQQTSDKELRVFYNTIAERFGDSPEVKAQKRTFRRLLNEAVRRVATGEIAGAAALDSLVAQARAGGLDQSLITQLQADAQFARENPDASSTPRLTRDPRDAQDMELRNRMILQLLGPD